MYHMSGQLVLPHAAGAHAQITNEKTGRLGITPNRRKLQQLARERSHTTPGPHHWHVCQSGVNLCDRIEIRK
jgi:hypothetical protein